MNKIVAVVGMCGSGKSLATECFVANGWNCIYFGGVTIDELKKRNLPINEQNERIVREELREEFGPAAIVVKLEEQIQESVNNCNTVIDGLYSWYEYIELKRVFGDNFIVLAIVTNKELRYSRLSNRKIRPLSFRDAERRDYAEIENLYKGGPIAIADYFIENNNDCPLKERICSFIEEIGKKR